MNTAITNIRCLRQDSGLLLWGPCRPTGALPQPPHSLSCFVQYISQRVLGSSSCISPAPFFREPIPGSHGRKHLGIVVPKTRRAHDKHPGIAAGATVAGRVSPEASPHAAVRCFPRGHRGTTKPLAGTCMRPRRGLSLFFRTLTSDEDPAHRFTPAFCGPTHSVLGSGRVSDSRRARREL